jgi:NAD(P)-dependent dehydrogenase (short-subunit alcohol dehydrogenase family)
MHPVGGILFPDLKTTQNNFYLVGPWQRYGQSKLANVLYASELAKHYGDKGILALSIHPGVFNTGLIRNLGWGNKWFIYLGHAGPPKDEKKEGEGSWNSCWAATSPREKIKNRRFYFPVGKDGVYRREMRNEVLAGELWDWAREELEGWN